MHNMFIDGSQLVGFSGFQIDAQTGTQTVTWDPALSNPVGPGITFSNGNLNVTYADAGFVGGFAANGTFATGKWYWEHVLISSPDMDRMYVGITTDNMPIGLPRESEEWYSASRYFATQKVGAGIVDYNAFPGWNPNDKIMLAVDMDSQKLWLGRNGSWYNSGDPAAGTGTWIHGFSLRAYRPFGLFENVTAAVRGAFKASDLSYGVPTGFAPIGI